MPDKAIGLSSLSTIRDWVKSLIPTKTSELTNDSDFITSADVYENVWFGQCSTAAGTVDKVVTTVSPSTRPFVLRKGSIIVVEFFYGVSGVTSNTPVTLNVDGTGARNVLLYTGEFVYNGAWQQFENVILAVDDTGFTMLGKGKASTSNYGLTMLSSETDSNSQLLAATPRAVKNALSAAKSYADGIVPSAADAAPLMDGTAAVGTSSDYAREDHVHPSDTSKVDKETGKGLSTNDFTTAYKDKLDGIASGAEVNVNADWNAVSGDAEILNKPSIPTKTSDLTNDSGFIDGTYISVDGTRYKVIGYFHTTLDGVTGLFIHYDNGTLDGGGVFLPDVNAVNSAYQTITGMIPTQYADSPSAGGNAKVTNAFLFGEVDSTSTATVFTATVPGLTELVSGTAVMLKNGVVTSASGFTLNINNFGAKPCYSNMATGNSVTPTSPTRETTVFNINYTMLFVYSEDIVSGGGWICYRGYGANTNTIGYQLRTNSSSLPTTQKFYRYRLLFTSPDGTHFIPSNTSTSTNATAARAVNQEPIDPFGRIVYYNYTTAIEANARPGATYLMDQMAITFGYAFNRTGAALTLTPWAPIYLKCAPQSDGSAIIDADTPYVQALPTTSDGKIYIFLGVAYSATAVELMMHHPVYYHDGTSVRQWTGVNVPTKTSDLIDDSGFATSNSLTIPLNAVNWVGNTQTVSALGATATNNVIVTYDPDDKDAYTAADIYCSAQGNGTLTFTCTDVPSTDVHVNVLVIG